MVQMAWIGTNGHRWHGWVQMVRGGADGHRWVQMVWMCTDGCGWAWIGADECGWAEGCGGLIYIHILIGNLEF